MGQEGFWLGMTGVGGGGGGGSGAGEALAGKITGKGKFRS